jgi:hypothetical protein
LTSRSLARIRNTPEEKQYSTDQAEKYLPNDLKVENQRRVEAGKVAWETRTARKRPPRPVATQTTKIETDLEPRFDPRVLRFTAQVPDIAPELLELINLLLRNWEHMTKAAQTEISDNMRRSASR